MDKIVRKEGFCYGFNPEACHGCQGNCCIGESGYIWVNDDEIKAIANYLKIDYTQCIEKFLVKIRYRYSIKEKKYLDGFACAFFDEEHLRCGIYEAGPNQCRTFPFWNYFKTREDEVKKECPGICF